MTLHMHCQFVKMGIKLSNSRLFLELEPETSLDSIFLKTGFSRFSQGAAGQIGQVGNGAVTAQKMVRVMLSTRPPTKIVTFDEN